MEPEFKTYQQQGVKNAKAMAKVFIDRGSTWSPTAPKTTCSCSDLVKQDITGKTRTPPLAAPTSPSTRTPCPTTRAPPFVTSGLRIGSPAITRRGFNEADATELAGWICDILDNMGDESVIDAVRGKVGEICKRLPVYER
jgi:glycine hydroxymethyltransferase